MISKCLSLSAKTTLLLLVIIKTGFQQCFQITIRGVSFRARMGNLAGFDLGVGERGLLQGPGHLLVKQTEEEGEGSRRDMGSGQTDCSGSFRMTL